MTSGSGIRHRPRYLAGVSLVLWALLTAGCGGATDHAQVASLPHPGRPHTTTRTVRADEGIPDPDGRPRQGLDQNSQQQLDTLYNPYYRCVYDEHHVKPKGTPGWMSSLRRAVNACIRLEPLPPWPLDPANPQARAFIGRTVTCMREEGYRATAALDPGYVVNAPEWTVTYQPGIDNVSERVAAIQYRCQDRAQREAAG